MKEPIAPIIHRLMRELEDGSVEVAGYMSIKSGSVYYSLGLCPVKNRWLPRHIACVGKWDRVDRDTGVTLNDEAKTKVFERDYLEEVKPKPYYCIAGYVQWNPKTLAWSVVKEGVGQCSLHDMLKGLEYFKESKIKIVGIDGVHKTEERGKA